MIAILFVVERKFQSMKAEYMAQEKLNEKLAHCTEDALPNDSTANETEHPEVTTANIP